jgi:hypothetical protein
MIQASMVLLMVAAASPVLAAEADDAAWPGWEMVLGKWVGDEGRGKPGTLTAGGFTFERDLGGKVLLRRDWADVAASAGRPAARHEGLMVVHPAPAGPAYRAHYFDNEGHVIEYDVTVAPQDKRIVFLSAAKPDAPRFRLTYQAIPAGLSVKFEIAPPGQPERFSTYVEGTAHRADSR